MTKIQEEKFENCFKKLNEENKQIFNSIKHLKDRLFYLEGIIYRIEKQLK